MRMFLITYFLLLTVVARAQAGNLCKATVHYKDVLKNERFIIPHVVMANKKVQSAINAQLLPENYTALSIEGIRQQEAGHIEDTDANRISEIDPEVKYNANCILSMHMEVTEEAVIISASEGTYPISHNYLTFDLATGRQLHIADIIRKDKIKFLLQKLNKKLDRNYEITRIEYEGTYNVNGYSGYEFTVEDLDRFYFTRQGISFHYDFHFMRCDKAFEPNGIINLTNAELKPLVTNLKYIR